MYVTPINETQPDTGLEDWSALVPAEIASITGHKMVETSLEYGVFKNHSHYLSAKDHAVRSTFHKLDQDGMRGKDEITLASMQQWLKEYYHVANNATRNTTGTDEEFIHQAAVSTMKLMGASGPNDTVSMEQFRNFTDRLLATKFKYAYSVCQTMMFRNEQCKHIAHDSGNATLKKMYKKVDDVQEVVQDFCTSGLTSLGRYKVEMCQLTIPFDPISMSEQEQQQSCYMQFQCYRVKDLPDLENNSTSPNLTQQQVEPGQNLQQVMNQQRQSVDVTIQLLTPMVAGMQALIRALTNSAFDYYRALAIGMFSVAIIALVGIVMMPNFWGTGPRFMFFWVKLLIVAFLGTHFALTHMRHELEDAKVYHELPEM